jgi:hypothetical protein
LINTIRPDPTSGTLAYCRLFTPLPERSKKKRDS